MGRLRRQVSSSLLAVVLVAAVALSGCGLIPKSGIGKGVKTGVVTKTTVEFAMGEVIRMNCAGATDEELLAAKAAGKPCERKITKANYDQAADAYAKYEVLQRTYADALITWSRTKSAAADQKVQASLKELRTQGENLMSIVCAFKRGNDTLTGLCAEVGR